VTVMTAGRWIFCNWDIWQHWKGLCPWWHGNVTLHEEFWHWQHLSSVCT